MTFKINNSFDTSPRRDRLAKLQFLEAFYGEKANEAGRPVSHTKGSSNQPIYFNLLSIQRHFYYFTYNIGDFRALSRSAQCAAEHDSD